MRHKDLEAFVLVARGTVMDYDLIVLSVLSLVPKVVVCTYVAVLRLHFVAERAPPGKIRIETRKSISSEGEGQVPFVDCSQHDYTGCEHDASGPSSQSIYTIPVGHPSRAARPRRPKSD